MGWSRSNGAFAAPLNSRNDNKDHTYGESAHLITHYSTKTRACMCFCRICWGIGGCICRGCSGEGHAGCRNATAR